MGRTVIVGDVHGCVEELDELLDRIALSTSDALVFVGDLVVRGPSPHQVLSRLRKLGARSVRGNHEERLLRLRETEAAEATRKDRGRKDKGGRKEASPGAEAAREAARDLTARDWETLEGLPLWLDLPEHGVRVVHAGLLPGLPIHEQSPRVLMSIRCVNGKGEAVEERGHRPWAERYAGPEHVVYGHNAGREPVFFTHATGLDTGAVYGGHLTALVLPAGAAVPPVAERREALVSVAARRAYADR